MLTLKGVGKHFGARVILHGVSLSVPAGSIALLTGQNGAGKSTLLRLMAGLLTPDAGDIRRACPDNAIAYLGHATFLYNELTALENLSFWDRLNGGDGGNARLMETLDRVKLAPFADERAGTFSRGMAQRLNLARVLLRPPSLLLLDEPATGLDARSTAMLRQEIRAARDKGAAVIWITHAPADDASLADTIFSLDGGTLAFSGPPVQWRAKTGPASRGGASC